MAIKQYEKDGQQFYEVYVNVQDEHGKRYQQRRKNIKSLREAKTVEFEFKRLFVNEKENPSYTWEDWHKLCLDRMKLEMRPSTIMSYDLTLKKWLHPIWRAKDLKDITSQNVYDLIFKDLEHCKPNSKKHVLKMVKRILGMAVEEGVLERNPASKVKVKLPDVKQSVLNSNEANILLKEAKTLGHRYYEVWAMALLTGMRSGELYALKWIDVDFDSRRVYVNQSWCSKAGLGPTKSTRNRVVPISSELERLLKELKLKNPLGYEFVLPHHNDWSKGMQAKVLKDFCRGIKITPIKFHDLRATFITQLLLKGVPLAQVMAIVGHADLKTTNVYLRIIGSDLEGATDKLGICLPQDQLAQVIDVNFRGD